MVRECRLAEDAKALMLKEGEEKNDIHITVEQEQRYRVIVWPSGPEDQPNPDRYSVSIEGGAILQHKSQTAVT